MAREKFEGREVVVLEADDSRNNPERFYFDTESGLLVRHTTENFMGFGPVAEETRYDHYELVDSLLRPRSQRVTGLWLTASEQYETFQLNPPIPPGKFDPPPAAPVAKH